VRSSPFSDERAEGTENAAAKEGNYQHEKDAKEQIVLVGNQT
jgi:hypothetical protein